MSSTLESITQHNSTYAPPQLTQPNHPYMCHDPNHSLWLDHDNSSSFSDNFAIINKFLFDDTENFSCSSSSHSTTLPCLGLSDLDNSIEQQSYGFNTGLARKGYDKSRCSVDGFEEIGLVGEGYYQVFDHGRDACNVYNTYQNHGSSNNFDVTPPTTWFHGNMSSGSRSENSGTKVGRYSAEERRDRILRYLNKRNHRNFRKTIKYACRKTLADRRVRIRGRFAKNQEDESHANNYNMNLQDNPMLPYLGLDKNNEAYCDEEWLREAMATLMQASIVGPHAW